MSSYFKEKISPENYAREILEQLKIETIPTPIDFICENFNISIVYTDNIDADAIIYRDSDKTFFFIKKTDKYYSRTRFSIAHELGHYFIPSHMEEVYSCTFDALSYLPNKEAEKEANDFAAELLMPLKHFKEDIRKRNLSIEYIIELSNKYDTSLVSTAIRYLNNCNDPGALVLSVNSRIEWCIYSKNFPKIIRYKYKPLHEYSYAIDFFTKGHTLDGTPQKVVAQAWSDSYPKEKLLIEESISMPQLNSTLSLILLDKREEDELEELDELE